MRIELVKRPQPSRLFSALSPVLALALTLIFGGLAFLVMGKDPLHALYVFFVEPLFDIWSWHELLVKAAPLILIAVGLCVCFLSNNWNIGRKASSSWAQLPVQFCRSCSPIWKLDRSAADDGDGYGRRGGLCLHSGPFESALQYE